jgi:Bacterial Ig-like domain (group 2)
VATGTFADGTTRSVAAIWTTDTPAVATVDRQGTVRGVSAGRANIIASFNGGTSVKPLRVVPNYAGRWSGSLVIVNCNMGDFRTCGRSYPIGTTGTLTLNVSQDRAAVTTNLEFTYHVVTSITNFVSTRIGNVAGTILDDGRLILDGKLQSRVSDTLVFDASTLWNWSSAADAVADTVRGSFQELSFSFGGYAQHVGWEFGPLMRVASP